jgi:hypothetical protein
MKTSRYLPVLALLFTFSLSITSGQKIKNYRAWVTLTNGDKVKGALSDANEHGLMIVDWETLDTVASIEAERIKVLKFRPKGAMGRGALIGAVSGATAGVIIGFADGDDEPGWFTMTAEEKAMAAGVGLALTGTFIGIIIGSLPKRMVIKGNRDTYIALLPEIERFVLKQSIVKPKL